MLCACHTSKIRAMSTLACFLLLATYVPLCLGMLLANSNIRAMSTLACFLLAMQDPCQLGLHTIPSRVCASVPTIPSRVCGRAVLYPVGYARYPYQYGYAVHVGILLARGRCFLATPHLGSHRTTGAGGPHSQQVFVISAIIFFTYTPGGI